MTLLLDWRYATKADRRLRQEFVCANPQKRSWNGYRLTHPAEWELEVQSWVRSSALRPGQSMMLGLNERGVGAVTSWVQGDTPSDILLQVVAVSLRYRRQGGTCAKEAMEETVSRIEARAREFGARSLLVEARIDHRNGPSQRMCAAAGFRFHHRADDRFEVWVCSR